MSDEKVIEENLTTVEIKLRKKHPRKSFRVQSVIIEGYVFKKYDFNDKELEELKSKGCKAWLITKEEFNKEKKAKKAKK